MTVLLELVKYTDKQGILGDCVWTISNFDCVSLVKWYVVLLGLKKFNSLNL